MCFELPCAFARLFFAGPVRLTRYWCCRVPRYSLLVCAVRVVCCFVFRPGHELCRVMSAVFMHRGMCEALFGVPVFRPGCEICRVMFALR